MEVGKYVSANRSKKTGTRFKGERTFHEVTHNPSSVGPGDYLAVRLPKLEKLLVLPGTLALAFDLDIVLDPDRPSNIVHTYPVNNVAANIISRITVKISSTTVLDLDNAHLYNSYRDLWLSENDRKNLVFEGIQDEELRQMRADIKASLPHVKPYNEELKNVFGKRYRLPLSLELIDDHTPLPTWDIEDNIMFELKINTKEYVLKYSNSDSANFNLNNITLQYETLDCSSLKDQIVKGLEFGLPFLFDHVHHYEKKEIMKKDILVNDKINIDRKSLKGILLLFQNEFNAGERDSEQFPDPKITDIKLTIGTSNKLYNAGYKRVHQWEEICRHFMPESPNARKLRSTSLKNGCHSHMDIQKFHSDNKFALWIDFRSTEDNDLHGTGKEQKSEQPIQLEISKINTGEGKLIMHTYVVSDARIIMKNKKFGHLEY